MPDHSGQTKQTSILRPKNEIYELTLDRGNHISRTGQDRHTWPAAEHDAPPLIQTANWPDYHPLGLLWRSRLIGCILI